MFELLKTEGAARRGVFTCAHGTVQTPVFMNVGTQGAIKGALSAAYPIPTICICAPAIRLSGIWEDSINL